MPTPPRIPRRAGRFLNILSESLCQPRVGESHNPLTPHGRDLGLTFVGHATFLLQLGGQTLLVDPNFANWLVLVKRLRRPGVELPSLPPVDWVLITHAHMDHLNRPSLRRIVGHTRRATGRAPGIILPRHTKDLVRDIDFSQVVELERWESFQTGQLQITQTPARHWGARMIHDSHRGFGGYVIEGAGHSIYHSGDTAYFEGFREIGQRLAPRLALLPIGAYQPDSFRGVHASPEDALRGFLDLGAETMVPMHYGTFRLSEEPMEEPVPRLLEAARAASVEDRMFVMEEGRTAFFPAGDKTSQGPQAELVEQAS
jgi:L-ascorbate metabolism protein UlaG (beta-lactamase superfamily)